MQHWPPAFFSLLGQLPHDLARRAHHQRAVGDFLAFADQRVGADDAVPADLGTVEDHRIDANQAVVADGAAMQHGVMPNRHTSAQGQRGSPKYVNASFVKRNRQTRKCSHMVPHFLIAETFSYDGSKDREKVVVDVDNLSEGNKEYFFGHEVYDDTVNELLGHSFSDEEIEEESKKVNALTRDYVFCKECEERFGVIETYYSQILEKKVKEYPPEIPYLFWMSVVWRMSVGQMGCKLERDHEEKLRKVLDKCLALKREDIVTKKVNWVIVHTVYIRP